MEEYLNLTDAEKAALVEKAYRLGYEYERKYGNCAQCVIASIQDVFGGIDDSVFKTAFGLAAGVGLTSKGTCGAVSGAVMVISSLRGRDREHLTTGKYGKCYELSRQIVSKYEEKYGSCLCHEVQKKVFGRSFDLWDREQYRDFEAAGGHRDKCPEVVGTAARWVAELIVAGEI